MNPIFKGYCDFLKDKTNLELEEGYYWLDNSIIKVFDKQGNIHKIYKVVIDKENLSVTYKIPKNYSRLADIDKADWHEVIEIFREQINEKEKESLDLIRKAIKERENSTLEILTSGGKDSSVVMHLVRKLYPNTHAIFNNTSLDCADTYLHVKKLDNVEIINPKEGFYQWRERLQFIPTRFARACCSIFKEGAMIETLPHDKNYLFFLGMRNEESSTRANYQDMWKNPKWGNNWQGCLPIRKWTELEIWLYILRENILFNPKYKKGYSRAGCAVSCPFSSKTTWVLDRYWYPTMRKRWEDILKEDFIKNKKWITLNCTLEEYITQAWSGGVFREDPTEEVVKEYARYNQIDEKIAKQYFNKYCSNNCRTPLKRIKDKETLSMNLKYHGRNTNVFYCKKCFTTIYDMSEEKWKEEIQKFKEAGCDLF